MEVGLTGRDEVLLSFSFSFFSFFLFILSFHFSFHFSVSFSSSSDASTLTTSIIAAAAVVVSAGALLSLRTSRMCLLFSRIKKKKERGKHNGRKWDVAQGTLGGKVRIMTEFSTFHFISSILFPFLFLILLLFLLGF